MLAHNSLYITFSLPFLKGPRIATEELKQSCQIKHSVGAVLLLLVVLLHCYLNLAFVQDDQLTLSDG